LSFTVLYIAIGFCLLLFIVHIFVKRNTPINSEDLIHLRPVRVNTQCNWIIVFEKGFNKNNLLNGSIYVLDDNNLLVPVKISIKDRNTLIIHAPVNGYKVGKSYSLYLNDRLDLKSSSERNYKLQFNVSK